MKQSISIETLTAYVLGELSEEQHDKIAALVKRSSRVRQAVEKLEATAKLTTQAFSSSTENAYALTEDQRETVRGEAARGGLFNEPPGLFDTQHDTFQDSPFDRDGGIFSGQDQTEAPDADIFSSAPRDIVDSGPADYSARSASLGQRNENSVLFSLKNLQTLAVESHRKTPSVAPQEEASGLIDIRALAQMTTEEAASPNDMTHTPSIDVFSPLLSAPTLATPTKGLSIWMKVGLAAGIALVSAGAAIVAILALGESDNNTDAQIAALTKQIEALTKNAEGNENDAVIAKLTARLEEKKLAQKENREAPADEPDSKSIKEVAKVAKAETPKRAASNRSTNRKSAAAARSATTGSASKSTSTQKASSPPNKPKPTNELDDLLGSGSKRKSAPKASSSSSTVSKSSLKANLSRSDVQKGMSNVAPAVKRCGQGKGGVITMNVLIGKTGRVSSASATGAFAGTPIGACAARAVRRARFPASAQSLNVRYPFKL